MEQQEQSKRDNLQEYSKKLQSLQEYIPFLENMIAQLKDPKKKNREQQLAKMVSLHDMITNKKITKLDTLTKCEDVLIKLRSKVKSNEKKEQNNVHEGQKFVCRPLPVESKLSIEKKREDVFKFESARARLQEVRVPAKQSKHSRSSRTFEMQDVTTPASPSPPRELFPANPIVIPTEKVVNKIVDPKDFHIASFPVVSAADRKLVVEELKERIPDISKPPISVEDLKILQDDDDEEEGFQEASLEELEGMRGSIMKQLEGKTEEDDKRPPSPIKIVDLSQPDVEEQSVLVVNSSVTEKVKESLKPKPQPATPPKVVEKVIKDADSIFGSTLSSIDAFVLKNQKEKKKDVKKVDEQKKSEKTEKTKDKKETKDVHRKDSRSDKKESTKSDKKDSRDDRKDKKESVSERDRKESSSKAKDSKSWDKEKYTSKEKTAKEDKKDTAKEEKKEEKLAPKPLSQKLQTIPLISGEEAAKDEPVVKRFSDTFRRKPPEVVDMEIDDIVDLTDTIQNQIDTEKIISTITPCLRPMDPRIKATPDTINRSIPLSGKPPDPLSTILQHIRMASSTTTPLIQESLLPTPHQLFDKQFTTTAAATFNQTFIPPTNHNQYQSFNQPQPQPQPLLQQQYIPPHNQCQQPQTVFPNSNNNSSSSSNIPPNRSNTFVNTFIVQHNNVSQNQFGPAVNTNQNLNMNIFQQQQQHQPPQPKKTFNPYEPIRSEKDGFYGSSHQSTSYGARNAVQRALPSAYDPRPFVRDRKVNEYGDKDERHAAASGKKEARDPRIRAREMREARQSVDAREERSGARSGYEPYSRRDTEMSRNRDRMHSRSRGRDDRERSRGHVRDDKFMSPLDSLYGSEGPSKSFVGKGYGVQRFKIPKIRREEKEEWPEKEENWLEKEENWLEKEEDWLEKDKERNSSSPEKKDEIEKSDDKKTEIKDELEKVADEKSEVEQQTKVEEKVEKKELEVVETPKEPHPKQEEPFPKLEEVQKLKTEEEKKSQEEEKATKSDHAVLGEFFANLLGSNTNKQNLFLTLFSTLADSLSTQQKKKFIRIQQIADDSESSADEEEEKSSSAATKTTEPKVEEEPKKAAVEEETRSKPGPKSKKKGPKKGAKAAKLAEVAPPPPTEVVAEEEEEEEGEEEEKVEEGAVVESVGERIKSRKRTPPTKPKRKKFRTELDLLHEDIKDMFIRDGVLTASGKRVCSMLKNGQPPAESTRNATNESDTKKLQQPVKERKKSVPKKKTLAPPKKQLDESEEVDEEEEEEEEVEPRSARKKLSANANSKLEKAKRNAKSTNPCVILERMVPPVSPKKIAQKKTLPKRKNDDTTDSETDNPARRSNLRRSAIKQIKYAEDESDEESVASTVGTSQQQQQQQPHQQKVEAEEKEVEIETNEDTQQGVKRKMKKPRSSWSKGVIKKKNRPSAKSDRSSDRSSPSRAETESEHDAEPEPAKEPEQEHDKRLPLVEYYIGMQTKVFCYLCNFRGKAVVSHYRIAHPNDEVLIARVSPETAKKCIQESQDQNYDGVQEVDLLEDKGIKKKFNFACVFCDLESTDSAETFHDHLSTHTGEFRFCCTICTYKTHQNRALNAHVWAAHRVKNTTGANRSAPPNYSIVFGYMCGECHYTQLQRSMLELHVKKHQSGVRIYKVNLSKVVAAKMVDSVIEKSPVVIEEEAPPVLEPQTKLPKAEPEPDKVEIKTEKIDELVSTTFIKEEPIEEVVKEKETPLGVFLGQSDDVNEENQKIEEERKKRMEEVNSEVAARGPRLTFVDSLKSKLEQQLMMHTPQEENVENNSEILTTPLPPPAKRLKLAPLLKSVLKVEPKDLQAKSNTPIEETIQRLQQILPPPMISINELEPQSLDYEEEMVFDKCFAIKKSKETLVYACLMPTCILATDIAELFMRHCRHAHGSAGISAKCRLCTCEDVSYSSMEGMFRHVLTEHHDEVVKGTEPVCTLKKEPNESGAEETSPVPPPPAQPMLIRLRRFSSDQLSMKGEDRRKDETREENVVVMDENSGFPFKITSVTTQPDEDNNHEFPFAIANVMSLAADDEKAMRVLKSPPPLSPIATPPPLPATDAQSPSTTPKKTTTHRVVLKDIPMPRNNIPIKSEEATKFMMRNSHHLYKCPSYHCTFSSNVRSAFQEHLRTHTSFFEKGARVPCVYCNYGNALDHVLIHVDARHGKCSFCCSLCFYRGATHSHVKYHMLSQHGQTDGVVVQVPLNQQAQNVKVPMVLPTLKGLFKGLLLDCPEKDCDECFLTYKEFYTHFATHFDESCQVVKTVPCPKSDCKYVAVVNPNVQIVNKAKLFTHHYMRDHNIRRYICRYCPSSHTQLSEAYIHLADMHSSYPIDIIEREYKPGFKPYGPCHTEGHYEQLRRIREEGPPLLVKRPASNAELKQYVKKELTSPQKQPVVLNSILGMKGTAAAVSSISSRLPPPATAPAPLDEPLVNIEGGEREEGAAVEEDPLSLENEGCAGAAVAAAAAATGQVDSDASSVNFDALSVSNVSLTEESDSMDTDFEVSAEESNQPGIRKEGYTGKQLFKCLKCDGGFENSVQFRFHLSKCIEQAKTVNKPYRCFHCNKDLRSVYSLAEHIKIHGTVRYGCSLCDFKHPSNLHVRNHMKSRHSVTSVAVMPVDPKRNDPDRDEFIMRPKLKRKSIGENPQEQQASGTDDAEQNSMKISFSPHEIDLLPRRPIYSTEMRCSICNFSTKVRTNLVRHLEFHSLEKVVPTTAPVNPVPCLEKNEKMFDKMTNLAMSSFANTTRMGDKLTKEEEAQLPVFVPTTKRFVCGAIGCNYLCLEDTLLKHHLIALHPDETIYYCKHCNVNLCTDKIINIDVVLKHYKLHDLHLYKCAHCKFVHNLKHKVQRHISERHLDKEMHVIVVRKMECEPEIGAATPAVYDKQEAPVVSMVRPWHCGICKWRTNTREEIVAHVENKHDIAEQYKCPLCTYKSPTKDSFTTHFIEKHPGNPVDIITAFYKADEIEHKATTNKPDVSTFDTTPLWQRDKQRVRHIRGILFEECGKLPKKVPIKLQPMDTVVKMQDNLDRAIEAVVNAEDTKTTTTKGKGEKDFNDQKIEALDKQINDALNSIMSRRVEGAEKVEGKGDGVILIEDEGGEESEVMGMFGPFGKPLNNKFLCPLCARFKTRNIDMIRFHLYEELQYFRYQCNVCAKKGIERKFIARHIARKHPTVSGDDTQIIILHKNALIEKWVDEVLEVQGRSLQNTDEESTTTEEPQQEQSEPESNEPIDDPKKFKCGHCDYKTKYQGDLRKHERRHLLQKPLKCGHCDFEGVINNDIKQHSKNKHKGLPISIVFNPMPSKPTMAPITKRRSRGRPPLSAAAGSSTAPSADEEMDVDVTTVERDTGGGQCKEGGDEGESEEAATGSLLREKLEGSLKQYKCKICEHTSDSYVYMRTDHIRSHFKPFECAYCKKRYNYPSQVTGHITMCHPELAPKYNVLEEENERIKDILKCYMSELKPDGTYGLVVTKNWKRKATSSGGSNSTSPPAAKKIDIGDENDLLVVQKVTTEKRRNVAPVVRNIALKSTAKPSADYGVSSYGVKPDYGDLKKITTTIKINNADVTRTVEQFSHIFNLYPNVLVEDCMKVKRTGGDDM